MFFLWIFGDEYSFWYFFCFSYIYTKRKGKIFLCFLRFWRNKYDRGYIYIQKMEDIQRCGINDHDTSKTYQNARNLPGSGAKNLIGLKTVNKSQPRIWSTQVKLSKGQCKCPRSIRIFPGRYVPTRKWIVLKTCSWSSDFEREKV